MPRGIRTEVKPGDKYGRLTVIKEVEKHIQPSGQKVRRVMCACECGNKEVIVNLNDLIRGITKSCGCYKNEKSRERLKKYNRYIFNNDGTVTSYTSKNEPFYFDEDDYDLIKDYCWYLDGRGYVLARADKNKNIRFHRLILHVEEDEIVDHINRIKHDNRKNNLRKCTQSENTRNKSIRKNNKTGITGVGFNKQLNKWTAEISVNYNRMYLGIFSTKEEAAEARLKAELELFGEYSPNYEKLTQQQSNQQSQHNT